jgi:hypothetical protein
LHSDKKNPPPPTSTGARSVTGVDTGAGVVTDAGRVTGVGTGAGVVTDAGSVT